MVRAGRGGDDCASCGILYVLLPDVMLDGVMFKLRSRRGNWRSVSSAPPSTVAEVSMKDTFCGSISSMDGVGMAVCITLPLFGGEPTDEDNPLLRCGVMVRAAATGRLLLEGVC